MIEAIIFDMDGVIAHTSLIHASAESMLFAKVGISISEEDIIKNYSGGKDIDTFRDVLKKASVKQDPEKLREEKWRMIYGDLSHQNITPILGVREFIEELKSENYVLAVASSAPAKFVALVLEALGLKKDFPVLTSGDEVSIGKPNPAIFLLTAKKLHVSPQVCLVLEDAPNGIMAAKAADMMAVGITTTHTKDKLKGADKIIDSFSEINLKEMQSL